MYIVLIAETLERAEEELRSLVRANRDDVSNYDRQNRCALFEDCTLMIKAFSIHDLTPILLSIPHQIFCTRDAFESAEVEFIYEKVKYRHPDIPEDYIIQILEEEREVTYE